MKKYIILLFIFFFNINAHSSSNQKIINHLENINSLQFKFTQRIDNNNIEKGDWIHKGKTSKGAPLHEIWEKRKK